MFWVRLVCRLSQPVKRRTQPHMGSSMQDFTPSRVCIFSTVSATVPAENRLSRSNQVLYIQDQNSKVQKIGISGICPSSFRTQNLLVPESIRLRACGRPRLAF
jgi:hypothetical protein